MDGPKFVKSHEHRHHAFLSYNTQDVQLVKPVATALELAGLDVYFAPMALRGGVDVNQQLKADLEGSRCLVLFVGPNGTGPYQDAEAEHASGRRQEIIKVVLPKGNPKRVAVWYGTATLDCNDPALCYELIDRLIHSISGMPLAREPLQIGTDREIALQHPQPERSRPLTVPSLYTIHRTQKLLLNWVTFGALIENLKSQIDDYPRSFYPDLYFGISPAGLAVVQFLNGRRMPVGSIHLEGGMGRRRILTENCTFPGLEGSPVILAVDSELKSGSAMQIAVQGLREKYPTSDIYFAALGAMLSKSGDDPNIKKLNVQELLAWPSVSEYLKDGLIQDIFVGSIFTEPGFDPPFKIR